MIYDVLMIGAGQSGLAMAYHLKQAGVNFLMLDAEQEIGASWLKRWDSLRLFTPTEFNHLPGMPFPAARGHYPDKADVANYLKSYVAKFELPVKLAHQVTRMCKTSDGFEVYCHDKLFKAQRVIIASGPFHTPFIPPCHRALCASIKQWHSSEYKNPAQLQPGSALVVGAGDSGFQILKEIAEHDPQRQVYFSGNTNQSSIPQEILGKTLWWWVSVLGLLSANKYSWLGKKLKNRFQPIIGTDIKSLLKRDNVRCVGKTLAGAQRELTFASGTLNSIDNIIWATGFKPDFSWIEGIALDADGYPENYRGIGKTPGMYFIGLPWMYTRGSATLGGVQKDAAFLAQHLLRSSRREDVALAEPDASSAAY